MKTYEAPKMETIRFTTEDITIELPNDEFGSLTAYNTYDKV